MPAVRSRLVRLLKIGAVVAIALVSGQTDSRAPPLPQPRGRQTGCRSPIHRRPSNARAPCSSRRCQPRQRKRSPTRRPRPNRWPIPPPRNRPGSSPSTERARRPTRSRATPTRESSTYQVGCPTSAPCPNVVTPQRTTQSLTASVAPNADLLVGQAQRSTRIVTSSTTDTVVSPTRSPHSSKPARMSASPAASSDRISHRQTTETVVDPRPDTWSPPHSTFRKTPFP